MLRILLDLDGVLVDLVPAAFKLYDMKIPDIWPTYDLSYYFSTHSSDLFMAADANWWANLPATPEAEAIVGLSKSFTSCVVPVTRPLNPASAAGKIMWLERNFPCFNNMYVLTPYKNLLANGDTILIDDSQVLIDLFNRSGGRGLAYARPWNSKHAQSNQSFDDLSRRLANCVEAHSNCCWEIGLDGKDWV